MGAEVGSLPARRVLTQLFLTPCQKKASELKGPVKPLQPKGRLVAHPVGTTIPTRNVGSLAHGLQGSEMSDQLLGC